MSGGRWQRGGPYEGGRGGRGFYVVVRGSLAAVQDYDCGLRLRDGTAAEGDRGAPVLGRDESPFLAFLDSS